MIFTTFKDEDLEKLMLFLDHNLTEYYQKEVFLSIRNRWPEGFILIKDQEEIVGVGCGAVQVNSKLRILILAVSDSLRRKGFGSKLLNMMIERALKFGIKKVTLEVREDSSAFQFYKKLLFSSVDLLPCYYQDGCDGIVMEKQI